MYCIPQRDLYYIASSHLPKLNFMAVDLQLGTHIKLEVNLNFRFLLCCCCYCCCCCFNIIYLLSRFPQLVYKCNWFFFILRSFIFILAGRKCIILLISAHISKLSQSFGHMLLSSTSWLFHFCIIHPFNKYTSFPWIHSTHF